jgi:hypothetical protein
MTSRLRRHVLCTTFVAFFLSSCAEVQHMKTDGRSCRPTLLGTVELFLEGMRETSVALLKMAIPESWSVWAIFGEGSISKGQVNVHEIIRYLGAGRDDNVGISYDLDSVSDTQIATVKIVRVERTVEIIKPGKKVEEAEVEVYRRSFRVTFVPLTNCIMDVQKIESEWVRTKE